MSGKTPKNLSASVRERLLNRSRQENRPFNELLQYYAMERFLYRLSRSPYADKFILKGGLLLMAWRFPENRPTMDIDMLGKTSSEVSRLISQMQEIIALEVDPDGLFFNPDSVRAERIIEHAEYEGVRILLNGKLGSARIYLQIDIGFNDVVYPDSEKIDLPAILDFSRARLHCYSRESVIAEKLEIIVKLGELNSRMKDFHDIWSLSRYFDFDGMRLSEAIRLTFKQRETPFPETIIFTDHFIAQKDIQWKAFRKLLQQSNVPDSIEDVLESMKGFLSPPVHALSSGIPFTQNWTAPGPWK